ncbi:MAG: hypothetical protein QM800_06505 [Paludibacter sp.]
MRSRFASPAGYAAIDKTLHTVFGWEALAESGGSVQSSYICVP